MKKKLLIGLIPVLAAGGLIGTAFSAWVFTENASTTLSTGLSGTVEVTDVVSADSIVVNFPNLGSNKFALQLDQGGQSNANNLTKGISFTQNAIDDSSFDFTVTLPATFDDQTQDVVVSYVIGINFASTETLTVSDSNSYIEFAKGDADDKKTISSGDVTLDATANKTDFGTNGNATYTHEETQEGNHQYSFDLTVLDDNDTMFYYVTGKKPSNASEHQAMVDYYKGKELRIFVNVTATIVDKTTN